ncbi:uncharacterized protein LY79DRAFT_46957 [Colletotrichum navitas]|uniref:Uncharacterized protein n=1 Tax=Colletotrichum navitas TaxID=681940 RepID=A0AAD8UYJ6_9PEZI|nr:uncharacterized protein LY79DRAFT_46957 [Colletotrichum navitas]KAK1570196.1 hypothetical protein LY79DRAFT_46957 [Colletotrichum navitas]
MIIPTSEALYTNTPTSFNLTTVGPVSEASYLPSLASGANENDDDSDSTVDPDDSASRVRPPRRPRRHSRAPPAPPAEQEPIQDLVNVALPAAQAVSLWCASHDSNTRELEVPANLIRQIEERTQRRVQAQVNAYNERRARLQQARDAMARQILDIRAVLQTVVT